MFLHDPFLPLMSQLTRQAAFMPATDVAVSDGDLVLTMDIPGVTPEDLSLELADGYLVVRGERRRPEVSENTQWAHTERSFGRFERRIKVPDGIDVEKVTANVDHGVLSLIVPKPERLRPRTIPIGSGAREEQRQLETA